MRKISSGERERERHNISWRRYSAAVWRKLAYLKIPNPDLGPEKPAGSVSQILIGAAPKSNRLILGPCQGPSEKFHQNQSITC